jgi:alkyl sulfatase BDS1-like metallo-beta-lactamase superfamily hydrolase
MKRLTGYMDQLTLTYDQTLRGILAGMGPDELRHAIYIPEHMQEIPENAQSYGETIHFPAAIYQYVIGWFDGDVTKLFKIAPKDEALRMVELMGGKDKVVEAAKSALDKKEYAWGTQVIQYVYLLEPENKEVRNLKAELLRQMAYRTTGSIARAFLMTEALTLEGKISYPRLIPPGAETIADSPETFVNFFRVRIDPRKSENTDKVVEFVFTDKGNHAVALHVRRGIAEYIPVPDDYYRQSNFVLKLDSETWVGLYLSSVSFMDAIDSGKVQLNGSKGEMVKLFDMFDKFRPSKNYMVPPLED